MRVEMVTAVLLLPDCCFCVLRSCLGDVLGCWVVVLELLDDWEAGNVVFVDTVEVELFEGQTRTPKHHLMSGYLIKLYQTHLTRHFLFGCTVHDDCSLQTVDYWVFVWPDLWPSVVSEVLTVWESLVVDLEVVVDGVVTCAVVSTGCVTCSSSITGKSPWSSSTDSGGSVSNTLE